MQRGGEVDECIDLGSELQRSGSIILIEGRTWHGTGANHSAASRPAILVNYCPPWVRPFANHGLDVDPAILASAAPELLELLGYDRWFVHGHSERNHLARLHA